MRYLKSQLKSNKSFAFSLILLSFAFCILPSRANALTMSNEDYIIQMSDFNMTSGNIKNSNYKMGTTVGQTSPGLFTGNNYKVKVGFEYIYPFEKPFSFSISQNTIDFGELTATNPVTRTLDLSVANPPPGGYLVLAMEDHTLLAPSNATIPDTSCDNGLCNDTTPAAWINTLTYGLGYRCDNLSEKDCTPGFEDQTYFMPFADNSKQKSQQTVMKGNKLYEQARSQITYKVNVSGTQVPGIYNNTITYIATPGY